MDSVSPLHLHFCLQDYILEYSGQRSKGKQALTHESHHTEPHNVMVSFSVWSVELLDASKSIVTESASELFVSRNTTLTNVTVSVTIDG